MSTITTFAPITKTELQSDGTLLAYGKMTGPDLDLDGQVCDPDWLKTAVPEWFETGANVRQMHQAIAAGVGVALEQQGDDYWLTAKVVDPTSIKLVDEGVLQGFSVGIKGPKLVKDAGAPNGRIVGGRIVETSLVDRPCNETAKLVLAKAVGVDGALVAVDQVLRKAEDGAMDVEGSVETGGEAAATTDDGAAQVTEALGDAEEQAQASILEQVRTLLAAWLASEAAEVASGEGSTFVPRLILDLITDLDWAASEDRWDDMAACKSAVVTALTTGPQEDDMNLTKLASLAKAATADTASEQDRAAVDELRKALGLDGLPDTITKAAMEAMRPHKEALDGLAATVAKISDTVSDLGPVRVRAGIGTADTTNPHLTKAAQFERLADIALDHELAAGYRELAAQERAAAAVA